MTTSPDSVTYPSQGYGILAPLPAYVVNVVDVPGCDPTGNDDSTEAFLTAAASLPSTGGVLFIPPGEYLLSRGIPLGSGDAVQGSSRHNTRIVAAVDFNLNMAASDPSYSFFYNENWASDTLADGDSDITVTGVTFDYSWSTVSNAFASVKFRHVTRLRIEDNRFYYGGNAIAIRGCERAWVAKNDAYEFRNCAWDFWEGPGTTYVTNNYAETSDTAQMLNFNPEFSPIASSPLNVSGRRLVVQGNVFKATGTAVEPLQIEPLANRDNSIDDVIITGNHFLRSYLVCRQQTTRMVITNNTFSDFVAPCPSVIVTYPLNSRDPNTIVIANNVIDEPLTTSSNQGVIWCDAQNAVVSGNVITGTSYDAAPFYAGGSEPNMFGNYFEKLGVTGRMRQGFLFTNPNDPAENFRSCIAWEDTSGDVLRMYMAGDFHQFWSTKADGTSRQIWSIQAHNSVQPFTWLSAVAHDDYVRLNISAGLTATGTNQSSALQLIANFNEVTTVAAGTGVVLPSGATTGNSGYELTVWNAGANTLNVYPPTSGQINALGLNVADTIASGSCKTYVGINSALYRIKT